MHMMLLALHLLFTNLCSLLNIRNTECFRIMQKLHSYLAHLSKTSSSHGVYFTSPPPPTVLQVEQMWLKYVATRGGEWGEFAPFTTICM